MTASYLIGIDFGTTNCTMAYAAIPQESPVLLSDFSIQQLAIEQVTASTVQGKELSLPSFLYFPLPEELKAKAASIDWAKDRPFCAGHFASNRGQEVPTRLISSAKSWLCHAGIDRREKRFPSDLEASDQKMSPLEACSEILRHLSEAWNKGMPDAAFLKQQIFVTVPASFDPGARQLVLEAAELAGYPEITLLEEPQAAFYAWIHAAKEEWRKLLRVGDHVLVIDIGGGTTDFSLISVVDEKGDLQLERVAVGAHLLLGGDNIDLSLAYLAKNKFENDGHEIDDWQLQKIVHACRQAKEKLFGEKPPKSVDIAIMGRGSRLIGGSLKVSITREEVERLVLDGFFPLVAPEEHSKTERQAGMQQIGLPYAEDPRISCQLAKFLSQTGEVDSKSLKEFIVPTAVLFNGGTTKASLLRKRMMAQLNMWAESLGKSPVKELPFADCEFAVSRGAVYYGMARQGMAIRIRSGISRSYFIGIEDAAPAVPGMETPLKAICVVPFGMEEGSELALEGQEFSLLVGKQATFRFFSHATLKLQDGSEPHMGSLVRRWKQELTELHPIETLLDKESTDGKTVHVQLKSKVTELGVLELWCVARDGRKWKLEFDIRK